MSLMLIYARVILRIIMPSCYSHHTHAIASVQSRPSTSSSQGKSLASLTPMQKLKQNSTKISNPRSNTNTSGDARSSEGWAVSSPRDVGSSSSVSASLQSSYKTPSPTSDAIRSSTSPQSPQFSTADRTILEELKRTINVRAAQFTFKGAGTVDGCGIARLGKKHHPYRREEVPYPRSYDREVLDLYVATRLYDFMQR